MRPAFIYAPAYESGAYLDFYLRDGNALGQTFENDEARRAHYTEELRKKLQDPEFRKIEGFPIGSDEDILNLSDPPYYTACPNPWIADFIGEWDEQKLDQPDGYHYHREPFATYLPCKILNEIDILHKRERSKRVPFIFRQGDHHASECC
jgi:hypothetical protein